TTTGTPRPGTLLPSAALTISNPFTTAGVPSAGTMLPGASLTLNNRYPAAGLPRAGTLFPAAAVTVANHAPDLIISSTHFPGFFFQGQNGATYALTVSN